MKAFRLSLGVFILLAACAAPAQAPPPGEAAAPATSTTAEQAPPEAEESPTEEESALQPDENGVLWVRNPTSGANLYLKMYWPGDWDGGQLPTLVLVPGGFGSSNDFAGQRRSAQDIADSGFTVITFDPDGRGQSEGEEDKNGHIQQDGLAEILLTAADLPGVDPANIGLVSYSYGVTMASGALARYPDLPIVFYIDWEGPADRDYTTHGCSADAPGIGSTVKMAPCEDEEFWAQREGVTFIAQILVPYQRVQFQNDHAQDIVAHALDMVNAAVGGTSPWVRLNDEAPNQTFSTSSPPRMIPGAAGGRLDKVIIDFASELFSTFGS